MAETIGALQEPFHVSSTLTLNFDAKTTVRRSANAVEDVLKDLFQAPAVVPMPDDADVVLPRLVLTSKHGHSTVTISQASVLLATNYTGEYRENFDLRIAYARERLPKLFEVIKALESVPRFTGVSCNARLLFTGTDDNEFVRRIYPAAFGAPPPEGVFEATHKMTRETDGRFYVIDTRETIRVWNDLIPGRFPGRLHKSGADLRGVSVTCDYNDRMAYNMDDTYLTSPERADEVLERGFRHIVAQCAEIRGAAK